MMTAVCAVALRVAVSVTVVDAATAAAVAANVADAEPDGTVTDAGTVSDALLLVRLTVVLAVAALVNVTVQVSGPAPVMDG